MPTPPLPPPTRRLVGLLLMLSGGLLALGFLLKVYVGVYTWSTMGMQSNAAFLLSVNLVALLASGFMVRWGLHMRRGDDGPRNPNANEIL